MLKVYIGKTLSNLPKVLDYTSESIVQFVDKPGEADYLLVPHNWTHIKNDVTFLSQYVDPKKFTIIFCIGDSDERVNFPRSIVFRTSQYKSALAKNEIIMPTVVKDLGAKFGVALRPKGTVPVVGFVGWANQSGVAKWKSMLKNCFKSGPRKKGLYFRQEATEVLKKSPLVKTNFILRDSYKQGGILEFAENIKQSDFTLAPKGDGNYSARFYETLSLGRLPILIDTESVLPLENEIKYDEFMIRVPYDKLEEMSTRVREYYDKISEESYIRAQEKARFVFKNHLEIDAYLKKVLRKDFLQKYHV